MSMISASRATPCSLNRGRIREIFKAS